MFFRITVYMVFILLSTLPLASLAAGQANNYFQRNSPPSSQTIRDPFTASSLMFEVARQSSAINNKGFTSSSLDAATPIPKMRLRGFIEQNKKAPLALLEVAGARTYLVREGDDINIDPSQPNSVIRVTKITRQSITVETGLLGVIRVQR
jgi:hypothetical protein